MKLGLAILPTEASPPPGDLGRLEHIESARAELGL